VKPDPEFLKLQLGDKVHISKECKGTTTSDVLLLYIQCCLLCT
jgi:hypothetical protein